MRVTVLGSGTSTGVPLLGCQCAVCKSPIEKNKRWRSSILVQSNSGMNVVVDTGPEFRLQLLRAGVSSLEHVLYTHLHADHLHGFDDLRGLYFNNQKPIHLFLNESNIYELKHRFHYAFEDTGYLGGRPEISLNPLPKDFVPFEVCGMNVETARMPHGNVMTNVFKFDRFLYATDFKEFTAEAIDRWSGKIDVMIASGLRWRDHKTHSTINETIELFSKLKVKRGIISHLSHEICFEQDSPKLPKGIEFAFDGLVVEC